MLSVSALLLAGGLVHAKKPKVDWAALEAEASRAAAIAPFAATAPPARLDAKGAYVMHPAPVAAGHCYRVAVAWPGDTPTILTFGMAGDTPDAPPPNAAFESRTVQAEQSPLAVSMCADHPGTAYITLTQTSDFRGLAAVNTKAQLQYAVAVTSHAEDPTAATARREQEKVRAAAVQAWMDQNVERARAEEAARAGVCTPCKAEWQRCTDAGVPRETCNTGYSFCAQPVVCGAPYAH